MSSYFVNPTFAGSLQQPNGQESFLGQLPLYPTAAAGYEALRHFPASYGAGSLPDKSYAAASPCFYQQAAAAANTVIAACNRASYDYGAACFYPADKDRGGGAASSPSGGSSKQRASSHPGDYLPCFAAADQHYKPESGPAKILTEEGCDRKYTSPVYPWMQRMNACAGKSLGCNQDSTRWGWGWHGVRVKGQVRDWGLGGGRWFLEWILFRRPMKSNDTCKPIRNLRHFAKFLCSLKFGLSCNTLGGKVHSNE